MRLILLMKVILKQTGRENLQVESSGLQLPYLFLVMTALGKGSQAETVAGLIMQGDAVVAYIIGEGLADAANAGTIDVDFSNEE